MNYIEDNQFDLLVGKFIKVCQQIEHDVKIMYAMMLKGKYERNIKLVENKTLGTVVNKLEELDFSDDNPYLNKESYDILKEITDKRNYWVHKGYMDFMYSTNYQKEKVVQYQLLNEDFRHIDNIARQLENIRIDLVKKYK